MIYSAYFINMKNNFKKGVAKPLNSLYIIRAVSIAKCPGGETGRRTGLKILRTSNSVPVRFRPRAPFMNCASSSTG